MCGVYGLLRCLPPVVPRRGSQPLHQRSGRDGYRGRPAPDGGYLPGSRRDTDRGSRCAARLQGHQGADGDQHVRILGARISSLIHGRDYFPSAAILYMGRLRARIVRSCFSAVDSLSKRIAEGVVAAPLTLSALAEVRGFAREVFVFLRGILPAKHLVPVRKTAELLDDVAMQLGEVRDGFEGLAIGG